MAEFSEEEVDKMVQSFKTLGVKPKGDSPEELKSWMVQLVASGALGDVKPNINPTPVSHRQPPRIATFSGTSKDAAFDIWKYEIECLISEKVYSNEEILLAIRRSLKDSAARVLMHMGKTVTIQDIIHKFESVFGCVDRGQNLLSSFYSAKQGDTEDVTTFASRLEDLLSKAVEAGAIKPTDTNDMLCSVFYSGLNDYLKSISGYKFDKFKSFDELRVEVRRLEAELPCKTAHAKSAVASKDEQIEKLTGLVNQLRTDVNQFKTQLAERDNSSSRGRTSFRGQHGQRGQGRMFNTNSRYRNNHPSQTYSNTQDNENTIVCYRCGQKGHVKSGCRNRLSDGKPLNFRGSMAKGHP